MFADGVIVNDNTLIAITWCQDLGYQANSIH